MGITNALGLIGLSAIPIIIILYMLRPKNKPMVIPSLYLWKQMSDEIESAARLKKLKSSILMFIQIFIVLLMTLILAGLFLRNTSNATSVLLVIDCSYTMGSEDVEGNRLEYAKKLVEDYIYNLKDTSEISVLVLEETPRTLVKREVDKGFIMNAVNQLNVIDGISDIKLVTETIELLKEEGQEVIYFGDRSIGGISQVLTRKESKNYSVHDITYTKYNEVSSITALTEVFNHDTEGALIPISLYVDDVFFSAKQVEIQGNTSGKLFFEDIPLSATKLHVQIDEEDILPIDNHAYRIVSSEKMQKTLLVSESNRFLEKALSLHPNIELYITSDELTGLYGYDLYIFDSVLPDEFPKDGNYLIFNPNKSEQFNLLGYVENPVFTTNRHPITNLIEKTEFSTRVTAVFEVNNPRDIIYNTQFGAGAFEITINDNKAIIFGFDIHQTDLPLSVEFPVLMMNSVEYLLTNKMVESGNYYAGDNIEVSIFPSTTKGSVLTPEGMTFDLDLSRLELMFTETSHVGTYTIFQENKDEVLEESFTVNLPQITMSEEKVESGKQKELPLTSKSLGRILGLCVVVFILLEWIIYSYRRKINVYTYE